MIERKVEERITRGKRGQPETGIRDMLTGNAAWRVEILDIRRILERAEGSSDFSLSEGKRKRLFQTLQILHDLVENGRRTRF